MFFKSEHFDWIFLTCAYWLWRESKFKIFYLLIRHWPQHFFHKRLANIFHIWIFTIFIFIYFIIHLYFLDVDLKIFLHYIFWINNYIFPIIICSFFYFEKIFSWNSINFGFLINTINSCQITNIIYAFIISNHFAFPENHQSNFMDFLVPLLRLKILIESRLSDCIFLKKI